MISLLRRLLALLLGTGLALGVALLPTAAWAHAGLVDSDPRDGATLDALPGEVRLTFTEDINPPAYVVVRHADGTAVAEGEAQVEGPLVRQALAADPDGTGGAYTLAYSVVSADGHRVTGELGFTVAGDAASPDPEPDPDPDAAPEQEPEPSEPAASPTDTGGASAPAAETDETDEADDAGDDEGTSTMSIVLLVVGAVVVVGALGLAVARRRSD